LVLDLGELHPWDGATSTNLMAMVMPNKTTSWPWTLPFRQSIPQHRRALGKQLLELIAF